jgi:hypothetical protein
MLICNFTPSGFGSKFMNRFKNHLFCFRCRRLFFSFVSFWWAQTILTTTQLIFVSKQKWRKLFLGELTLSQNLTMESRFSNKNGKRRKSECIQFVWNWSQCYRWILLPAELMKWLASGLSFSLVDLHKFNERFIYLDNEISR